MNVFLTKNSALIIFILTIVYGIGISVQNYFYSYIQVPYWVCFGLLIMLFFISKVHVRKLNRYQLIALTIILLLYFISWLIIPPIARFGVFLFATMCFLFSGLLLMNTKYRLPKLLFISCFTISSINLAALFFYVVEKSNLTRPIITALFISNYQESKEYFLGKLSVFMLFILLIFLIATWTVFHRRFRVPGQINVSITLLFLVSFGLSFISGPVGFLSSEYIQYHYYKQQLKEKIELRAKNIDASFQLITTHGTKKVLVIIGESLNRNYMSLYGYPKPTNPNLVKLSTDSTHGKLIKFTDAIASDVTTVPSILKLLTNSNNVNQLPIEQSVSVIDLFKKAGYKTFWLSNHALLGKYDSSTSIIADAADSIFFTAYQDTMATKKKSSGVYYDEDLIDVFQGNISKSKPMDKQIYFIHLLGSHFNYNERYPSNFEVFTAENKNENRYTNSVRYNDWVVDSLIKIALANQIDAIFYVSDHGEDLQFGHNQENYTKAMSEIPFLIVVSKAFIQQHQGIYNQLQRTKNTPIMTDNFFHDIQAVTGVVSSLYDPTLSFSSEHFKAVKRKVIDNTIPYDEGLN